MRFQELQQRQWWKPSYHFSFFFSFCYFLKVSQLVSQAVRQSKLQLFFFVFYGDFECFSDHHLVSSFRVFALLRFSSTFFLALSSCFPSCPCFCVCVCVCVCVCFCVCFCSFSFVPLPGRALLRTPMLLPAAIVLFRDKKKERAMARWHFSFYMSICICI